MTELKPCPFCGGEADQLLAGNVACRVCTAECADGEDWNRRSRLTLREALERALEDRYPGEPQGEWEVSAMKEVALLDDHGATVWRALELATEADDGS